MSIFRRHTTFQMMALRTVTLVTHKHTHTHLLSSHINPVYTAKERNQEVRR
jgi:hypothetical protein